MKVVISDGEVDLKIYDYEQTTGYTTSTNPGTTLLPDIFPGDSGRETDGLCSGTTGIGLYYFRHFIYEAIVDETDSARYGVDVYAWSTDPSASGFTFNGFSCYLKPYVQGETEYA